MIGKLSIQRTLYNGTHVKTRSTFMTLWMVVGIVVGTAQLWTALESFQNEGVLGSNALIGGLFMGLGIFCLVRFRSVKLVVRPRSADAAPGPGMARWTERRLLTGQKRIVDFLPKDITGVRVSEPKRGSSAVHLLVEGQERLLLVHLRKAHARSIQKVATALRVEFTHEYLGLSDPNDRWGRAPGLDFDQ